MSIRLRLTLWYTGILAVTLVFFALALYLFLYVKMNNDTMQTLKQRGDEFSSQIRIVKFPDYGFVQIVLPELKDFKYSDIYLQTYTVDGQIQRSSNLGFSLPLSQEAIEKVKQRKESFETAKIRQNMFLIYNKPMVLDNKEIGVLQVATTVDRTDSFLDSLRNILILLALLTVMLAASIGWFLARKSLKPIDQVIEAANQIAKGADLGKRIEYAGPRDEIGRLTGTINGMLARLQSTYQDLEEAYRAQRRFVSDASHELRTPLTTIRGNVELLQRMWRQKQSAIFGDEALRGENGNENELVEALKDISDEAERMSRLVNDLLSLARADAGYKMDKEPVLIKPIVEDVNRKAQFLPRKVEWIPGDLQALEDVWIMANPDYFRQLLFIFIENAFKYTEDGYVRVDAVRNEDRIGIRIEDTGAGMEKEEIPHIFERFYRADPSRGQTTGTGLGLSIAKWILDEHNGSVELTTRKNSGTTFVIWMPVDFSGSR
ncbi:sensor histidine kinase [Ferviditalea candida]|uniref:histidine kinase n=1 Tax=Ferviditalea candida TaxID=3108399 RepID=A0ABU5ZJT7_9BACL|nr:HAMP domain-containing sensor histidine kinase [Paenibacillaceae bacterium T2]